MSNDANYPAVTCQSLLRVLCECAIVSKCLCTYEVHSAPCRTMEKEESKEAEPRSKPVVSSSAGSPPIGREAINALTRSY